MAPDPLMANLQTSWPTYKNEVGQRKGLKQKGLANLANLANLSRGSARVCLRAKPGATVGLISFYTLQKGWSGWPGWPKAMISMTYLGQPRPSSSDEVGQVGQPGVLGPSRPTPACDVDAARHFASRTGSILTEHPEHVGECPNTPMRCRRLSTLATLSTRPETPPHWENPAPHSRRKVGRPGKDPRPGARPHAGLGLHHPRTICPHLRGNHGHCRSS